jgi:RNA polymerase sigma-70 factor (sigma-E family)
MRFEEFAQARLPALLRYATLLCGDRELARDMVQEVLTRALVRWRRISGLEEPYAYVRVMVTNEFLSWRRRRRVTTVALTPDAYAATTSDPSSAHGDRDEMWRRLAGLPRQQRAVLVLRYYEDLADPQIAEILGCRPATVRAYATRALAALRIELAATRTAEFALPPERKP